MQASLRALPLRRWTSFRTLHPSYAIPIRGKKKKAVGRGGSKSTADIADAVDVDLAPYRESMKKTIDTLQRNLSSIRTSGAHPKLLDNVKVEAYGALATLSKVAQVSVRDPRVLLVSVFDSAMSTAVERAIRGAGLNLNPSVESASAGRIVVPVPRPTKETREAMRKVAMKEAEAARVSARHVRRSAMDAVKKVKADLPAEEFKRLEKEVQAITDDAVKAIDKSILDKVNAIDKP